MENEKQHLLDDVTAFATRHSLNRVRVESDNFKREFTRQADDTFLLTSEKAVVRVLGKVSVIPIGESHTYKSFEEAEAWARQYWSDYFKQRREQRSDKERRNEARRQKAYRERRKAEQTEFKRRG